MRERETERDAVWKTAEFFTQRRWKRNEQTHHSMPKSWKYRRMSVLKVIPLEFTNCLCTICAYQHTKESPPSWCPELEVAYTAKNCGIVDFPFRKLTHCSLSIQSEQNLKKCIATPALDSLQNLIVIGQNWKIHILVFKHFLCGICLDLRLSQQLEGCSPSLALESKCLWNWWHLPSGQVHPSQTVTWNWLLLSQGSIALLPNKRNWI